MSILKPLSESRMWILLFVFLCQLVFAFPELMLFGMAIAAAWLFLSPRKQPDVRALPAAARAMWLFLLCFVSVFFFTYAWKALANGALLDSVTNSVFVFFSAWVWAELMWADKNARLDQSPVHS